MPKTSKRLDAWNFAWPHIAPIAGIGSLEKTSRQERLLEILERCTTSGSRHRLSKPLRWRLSRSGTSGGRVCKAPD
jgi:hypothetical protein